MTDFKTVIIISKVCKWVTLGFITELWSSYELGGIFKSWASNQVFLNLVTTITAPNKIKFGMLLSDVALEDNVTRGSWVPRVTEYVHQGEINNALEKQIPNKK